MNFDFIIINETKKMSEVETLKSLLENKDKQLISLQNEYDDFKGILFSLLNQKKFSFP